MSEQTHKVPSEILTTGQVAKICCVAPRTVSKWFDSGQLRGYRIPGSKDRRIPVNQLVRFMKAHGMPLNGLDGLKHRVLLIDSDRSLAERVAQSLQQQERFEVQIARCSFAAGILIERHRPHVLVVEVSTPHLDLASWLRFLRMDNELQGTRLLLTGSTPGEAELKAWREIGAEAFLAKPYSLQTLMQTIEDALSVIS
ncbi:MAG: hypothetical protein HJJLKODD_01391 [Phycisphaerae bacterium]|nr:hypothetical protein [Phycisphaerae bacterium]